MLKIIPRVKQPFFFFKSATASYFRVIKALSQTTPHVKRPFSTKIYTLSPFVTLHFFRILPSHAVFCPVSVYFGPASRSIFRALWPCHARNFLGFTHPPPPSPLSIFTCDVNYEWALMSIGYLKWWYKPLALFSVWLSHETMSFFEGLKKIVELFTSCIQTP